MKTTNHGHTPTEAQKAALEALAALLGKDAPNLSPAVLARLKSGWRLSV